MTNEEIIQIYNDLTTLKLKQEEDGIGIFQTVKGKAMALVFKTDTKLTELDVRFLNALIRSAVTTTAMEHGIIDLVEQRIKNLVDNKKNS